MSRRVTVRGLVSDTRYVLDCMIMMYYKAIYFTRPSMALEQSLMQSLYKVNLLGMALRLRLIVDRDHSSHLLVHNCSEWALIDLSRGVYIC